MTRSECCTRSRRVGNKVRNRVVGYEVATLKLREVESFDLTLTLLHGIILLGAKDMIKAHTVTDKVEDILRFLWCIGIPHRQESGGNKRHRQTEATNDKFY